MGSFNTEIEEEIQNQGLLQLFQVELSLKTRSLFHPNQSDL